MTSALENLCGPGKPLRQEAPDQAEFDGLLHSGKVRLKDAQNTQNAIESRFDLAYNAAHALCLAALKVGGIHANNTYPADDATKPDGMPRKLLDIGLIRSLGWEPRIPLEEGLKDAYQWFTQHAL